MKELPLPDELPGGSGGPLPFEQARCLGGKRLDPSESEEMPCAPLRLFFLQSRLPVLPQLRVRQAGSEAKAEVATARSWISQNEGPILHSTTRWLFSF